jgi:hypothetical protein
MNVEIFISLFCDLGLKFEQKIVGLPSGKTVGGDRKGQKVCSLYERKKTNKERRLAWSGGVEGGSASPYKYCKTSLVNSPYIEKSQVK